MSHRLLTLAAALALATAALGDTCLPTRPAHIARHAASAPVTRRRAIQHRHRAAACAPTALPILAPVTVDAPVSLDDLVADATTQTQALFAPTGNPYDVDVMPWWWIVTPVISGPEHRCRWHINCHARHPTVPEPAPLALLVAGVALIVARRLA